MMVSLRSWEENPGFAVGVERLLLALKNQGKLQVNLQGPAAYLVHFGGDTKLKAAQVAHFLRRQGLWVELDYLDRSVRAQMKAANKFGSQHVLVFGEEELKKNQVVVRNMQDGREQGIDLTKLEELTKILGACAK
mgnify:CR=1 FL=1